MKKSVIFPFSLALIAFIALTFVHSASACSIVSGVKITFYGYPDNMPSGTETAYSCGSRGANAGGSGTYSDPLTFASQDGQYKQCEIVYFPYLEKYLVFQDTFSGGNKHIDVWTGGNASSGQSVINCENQLTPVASQSIIRSPSKTLKVNSGALYSNGKCTGTTYANNNANSFC